MGIARSLFQRDSPQDDTDQPRKSIGTPYEEAQIQDFREQANNHRKEYHDFTSKAKNAYAKRQKSKAHTYSQHAHNHKQRMQQANQHAVQMLIQQQQNSVDNGELDLHGLYVREAIDCLKSVLEKEHGDEGRQLTVITGKGLHSKDGVAKIRPAVVDYLKKNKYTYTLSPGVVIVDTHSGAPTAQQTGKNGCTIS